MPLPTHPINVRALEKALRTLGGQQLYDLVIAAYRALDEFENNGHVIGFQDGFDAGHNVGVAQAQRSFIDEQDAADLQTAATLLEPGITAQQAEVSLPCDVEFSDDVKHTGPSLA